MSRRKKIIQDLKIGSDHLKTALVLLEDENEETQFDFCTSSQLSEVFNSVTSVVKQLDSIIYQR